MNGSVLLKVCAILLRILNLFLFIYNKILAAIKKDKDLEKLRYKLVPRKMSEYDFWRTYFYKVGIIKVAYNLDFSPRKRIIENQPQENINNEPKPVESTTPQVKKSNLIIEDSDEDDLNNQGENKKDETNEFVSEYFDNDINKDWNTEFQQELNELGISDEKLDQGISLMIIYFNKDFD